MKREDLRAIEGMTPELENAVMQLAGADRTAANAREQQLQQQVAAAQQAQATAEQQRAQLQQQMDKQQAEYRLRELIRTAAIAAGAYDPDDVVGALIKDTSITNSTEQTAAITTAVEMLKSSTKPHWFKKSSTADPDPAAQGRRIVTPKPAAGDPLAADPTVEDFAKMDYMERIRLKATNPALYAALLKDMAKLRNRY
nr:MAG TPA: minor structural protein [Caudoviricetes sp.]